MTADPEVSAWWRAAREAGLVGRRSSVRDHLERAEAFALAATTGSARPSAFVDLGTGAGTPGLLIARLWRGAQALLVDASPRRTEFVARWADRWGLAGSVRTWTGRAEALAREPDHRSAHRLVLARSFGPPPVVAEMAAPLLRPGGLLLVAEPPEASPGGERSGRWDEDGLAVLGLEDLGRTAGIRRLRLVHPCPEAYPRRVGVPERRPLW